VKPARRGFKDLAKVRVDWHPPLRGEPPCGPDQWRTRDRDRVIAISEMEDSHLCHCIRFASGKEAHESRLDALMAELARRPQAVASVARLRAAPDLGPAREPPAPPQAGRKIDLT
jgi:hypothetical protein